MTAEVKKLAIMQPYFMPYIGYFQLMMAADTFVIYDDVNFINRGWINRNNILMGGKAHLFTIPLQGASQNKLIKEVELLAEESWKNKFLKSIQQVYQKAPQFSVFFPLFEKIVRYNASSIADYCRNSFVEIKDYLGLEVELKLSSESYTNQYLKGSERIVDICVAEQASDYINAIGGMELYKQEDFQEKGVHLHFLKSSLKPYGQFNKEFVAGLSMIDVLMFNSPEEAIALLQEYQLV